MDRTPGVRCLPNSPDRPTPPRSRQDQHSGSTCDGQAPRTPQPAKRRPDGLLPAPDSANHRQRSPGWHRRDRAGRSVRTAHERAWWYRTRPPLPPKWCAGSRARRRYPRHCRSTSSHRGPTTSADHAGVGLETTRHHRQETAERLSFHHTKPLGPRKIRLPLESLGHVSAFLHVTRPGRSRPLSGSPPTVRSLASPASIKSCCASAAASGPQHARPACHSRCSCWLTRSWEDPVRSSFWLVTMPAVARFGV